MIESHISQLQHADPAIRRAAITALGSSGDPAALRLLAAVYRRDPDPALRELALKAGQYIQQHGQRTPSATGELPVDTDVKVSQREQELARGHLHSATEFHMGGDNARAVENLGKALSINPALLNEEFVTNLVMSTTGMSVARGVPVLIHPDRRAELIERLGGKRKLRRVPQGPAAHTATWENVAKDFGVYWLAATMSMVAILIFTLSVIQELFENMDLYSTGNVSEDIDVLLGASIIGLLVAAVFFGIYQVITVAVQGVFIHLAATTLFGGDGTLVYLFRRLVPFQTLVLMVTALVMLLLGFTGDTAALLFLIGFGAIIGSLYASYLYARLIGDVYAFGTWSGCGAIFLGGILQAVVFYVGNYMILGLLGALLGSAS